MKPQSLARLALSRLPRPYTDEVILHVFCEIERTPHLRKHYDALLTCKKPYEQRGLNSQIAQSVSRTLRAKAGGQIDVSDVCEIIGTVSRLKGVKSDWTWQDD